VYVTDVTPDLANQVQEVVIPTNLNVVATYPIAVVTGSHINTEAQQFVDYVVGLAHLLARDAEHVLRR